ncbi:cysteine hydrolase [Patescibacteria group bacterium]|nr:cysteine hydrolase [Patescibacteria group bacterium]
MKQGLLIVDVQNYSINKNTQHVPGLIKKLIEKNHFPVIMFSQFINTPNSQFVRQLNFTGCMRPPYSNIVDELRPWVKRDNVFIKNTFSVFANSGFERYLQEKKVDELVIAGLDTDYCVLADCFNAFDKGYKVTVVADCCASFTSGDAGHQVALEIIKDNLGTII